MDYIKEEQLNNLYRIAERHNNYDDYKKEAIPVVSTYTKDTKEALNMLLVTWNQYLDNLPDDEKCMACGQPIDSGNCYYCKMD